MTTAEIYREFARRSHKLLGAYLAFWAWKNKVNCVVLPREQLFPYLDLEEMRRAQWLQEDLEELFPEYKWTVSSATGRYETLYLSRFKIPDEVMRETMNDERRVAMLKAAGRRAAIVKIPPESEIIRMLAQLTHGISDFSEWEDGA